MVKYNDTSYLQFLRHKDLFERCLGFFPVEISSMMIKKKTNMYIYILKRF